MYTFIHIYTYLHWFADCIGEMQYLAQQACMVEWIVFFVDWVENTAPREIQINTNWFYESIVAIMSLQISYAGPESNGEAIIAPILNQTCLPIATIKPINESYLDIMINHVLGESLHFNFQVRYMLAHIHTYIHNLNILIHVQPLFAFSWFSEPAGNNTAAWLIFREVSAYVILIILRGIYTHIHAYISVTNRCFSALSHSSI